MRRTQIRREQVQEGTKRRLPAVLGLSHQDTFLSWGQCAAVPVGARLSLGAARPRGPGSVPSGWTAASAPWEVRQVPCDLEPPPSVMQLDGLGAKTPGNQTLVRQDISRSRGHLPGAKGEGQPPSHSPMVTPSLRTRLQRDLGLSPTRRRPRCRQSQRAPQASWPRGQGSGGWLGLVVSARKQEGRSRAWSGPPQPPVTRHRVSTSPELSTSWVRACPREARGACWGADGLRELTRPSGKPGDGRPRMRAGPLPAESSCAPAALPHVRATAAQQRVVALL